MSPSDRVRGKNTSFPLEFANQLFGAVYFSASVSLYLFSEPKIDR